MLLIAFILLLLNLFFMISVVFIEYKKPEEAILWVFILMVFPVVGMVIYLVLGNTINYKLSYWRKNKKLKVVYAEYVRKQVLYARNLSKSGNFSEAEFAETASVIRFNLNYSESLLMQKNDVEIFCWGQDKYAAMFADMRQAQKSIHIEYYAIDADKVGKELAAILTERAKAGVDVKVIIDGFGCLMTPASLFRPLREAGGVVKKTRPFGSHFRNHRKIVVIDGEIGYTGGMNIGKDFISEHKIKTPWRDTHMRVVGDGVYALQYIFLTDWIAMCRKKVIELELEKAPSYFPAHQVTNTLYCQYITGGIDSDKDAIKLSYLRMLTSAKNSILMQTPYIIPDNSILDALKVIAASGVEIKIMIAGIIPSVYLNPVTNYYIEQLVKYGVKIYKYNGYLHSKTMLIDDVLTCIGSVNFDTRSLEINDEVCAFFYDKQFAEKNTAIFAEDLQHCQELDYEAFAKRSWRARVAEKFFRIFTPIM